jgi:hypothetical protein
LINHNCIYLYCNACDVLQQRKAKKRNEKTNVCAVHMVIFKRLCMTLSDRNVCVSKMAFDRIYTELFWDTISEYKKKKVLKENTLKI